MLSKSNQVENHRTFSLRTEMLDRVAEMTKVN